MTRVSFASEIVLSEFASISSADTDRRIELKISVVEKIIKLSAFGG